MSRARGKTVFVCDACGHDSPKWEGRCPACERWNTLVEAQNSPDHVYSHSWSDGHKVTPQELSEISTEELPRIQVSSTEVNRVLGGGIVPGSLTLIAGDPGIGKSTLMLRLASDVSSSRNGTLYISGEESAAQIKIRAERLKISGQNLYLFQSTGLEEVLARLDGQMPALAVVDSIQTVYDPSLSSEAGSVAQIRHCTRRLMEWAKIHHVPIILCGHVTKGGDIAGPRVLEHIVDVVLYMEGDPISSWRLLRTVKNRFGSTNEVGVFEMTCNGLLDVLDPSRILLSGRKEHAVGSVVVATMEGSKSLLVEIQALTSLSLLPSPRRVATGIDFNRLLLVCAVLSRRVGIPLHNQDIVVNVTGGMKVTEPAADLGIALAIVSSLRNVPLSAGGAAIGEIGLSGEVRMVSLLDRRIREVVRLGIRDCLVPGSFENQLNPKGSVTITQVASVADAINRWIPDGKS